MISISCLMETSQMQSNNMKHIKSSHIVRQKIIFHYQCFSCERPSGLKFRVLDSGSRGLGSRSMGQGQRVKVNGSRSMGQGQYDKSLDKTSFTLSAQQYKWVLANCKGFLMRCWGVNLQSSFIQEGGGVVITLVASC